MPPIVFLSIMLLVTAAAWTAYRIVRHQHKRALRRLAEQWHMRYVQADLFHLAERLARNFPVPAAGDLRVLDILYSTEEDRHRYVFTAEYTQGVVERHQRCRRVATFSDPREAAGHAPSPIVLAPAKLPLLEQYRHLRSSAWGRDTAN